MPGESYYIVVLCKVLCLIQLKFTKRALDVRSVYVRALQMF